MNREALLSQRGFQEYGEFLLRAFRNESAEPLMVTGIYVLVVEKPFCRLRGDTDILYIGQSGGAKRGKGRFIRERLVDYCIGSASAPQDKKVHDTLRQLPPNLGKVLVLYKPLPIGDCLTAEKELLQGFRIEHLEPPPLNDQS
jgi:hypothetical protein